MVFVPYRKTNLAMRILFLGGEEEPAPICENGVT